LKKQYSTKKRRFFFFAKEKGTNGQEKLEAEPRSKLVKNAHMSVKILIKSLILAQDERWRRA
jgi:hypothetical protein